MSFKEQLVDRKNRLQETISEIGSRPDLNRLLSEVDAALERIESGTFGLCETCHEEIETERLVVDPLLRNCLDHLSSAEQRTLERDLDLAYQVQMNLLPKPTGSLSGWKTAFAYEPAGPVSGDFCDLVTVDSEGGGFYFILGDVSGKGIAASLLVANLHAIFRSLIPAAPSLPQLLFQANRLFCEASLSSHYATLVCGRADPDGAVELSNVGHCLPLILRDDQVERIQPHGLPLGIFCSTTYVSERIELKGGESIVLFSDGLVEASDQGGIHYGDERLAELLLSRRKEGPRGLVETILQDLHGFTAGTPKNDDLTLLVIEREKWLVS